MKVTRVTIICAWLATITFMSGFLVFIIKPWNMIKETGVDQVSSRGPSAEGLVGGDNSRISRRKQRKIEKRRLRKLETAEEKEARRLKRRARMLQEQEEYRQWRRDVVAGVVEEEDLVESALEELWSELFGGNGNEFK